MESPSVLWIIGHSAVGKETFINHLTSGNGEVILDVISAHMQPLTAKTSLQYLCSPDQTPIRDLRKHELPLEVSALAETNQPIFIKYQFVDTLDGTINLIRANTPDRNHVAIHLITPRDLALERLQTKSWWDASWNIDEFYEEEMALIKDVLGSIDMPIITIESQENYTYVIK